MSEGRGLTRRRALRLTIGGAGLAVVGGIVGWRAIGNDDDVGWLTAELESEFDYLRLGPGTARTFSERFVAELGSPDRSDLTPIADRFLRSTDFFLNDADEQAEVGFVALYDPFISPCFNPLATSLR